MNGYPALAIQHADIGGQFLNGVQVAQGQKDSQVRNRMLEQQMAEQEAAQQRDQQFREILAQSVGPTAAGAAAPPGEPGAASYLAQGMENPLGGASDAFNRMLAIDPERAVQFQQHFDAQRQAREAELRERAGVAVRAAQFVQRSKDPKRTLEIGFPEMVEQLKSQGIELADLDDEAVRIMADDVIAQFGPIAGVGPAQGESPFAKINPADYSPESVRAFEQSGNFGDLVALAKPDNDPNDKTFKRQTDLRKEYDNKRGAFETIRSAWENVQAAERGDAGDTQLVLNYMRLISPGIRIQPGQAIDDAASVPGVSAGVIGMWNKIVGDGKLNDSQRNELRSQARTTFARQEKLAREERDRYTELAEADGIEAWKVVGRDKGKSTETDAQGRRVFSSEAEAEAAGLEPGTKIVINGRAATWE